MIETVEQPAVVAPEKSLSDILLHAALIVEERGLARWTRESYEGQVCLIGAVEIARYGSIEDDNRNDAYSDPAVAAVEDYLGGEAADHWSDRPGRTAAEVAEVLRATAAANR